MKEDRIKQIIKIKVGFLLITEQDKYYECKFYGVEKDYVRAYALELIQSEFKRFITEDNKRYKKTYRFKRKRSIAKYLQHII